MFEDNTTGAVATESSAVAAVPQDAPTVTEAESVNDQLSSLEEFLSNGNEMEDEEEATTESGEPNSVHMPMDGSEPDEFANKGIRGRILAAEQKADARGYERGLAEAKKQYESERAKYETRIREFEEKQIEYDAKELSEKEGCSLEFAKRMLRLERNVPEQKQPERPRDEAGRFAAATDDSEKRANFLMKQGQEMQNTYGVDVFTEFKRNEEVKRKVASGEWDFKDVALSMIQANSTPKKQTPRPVSSTNSTRNGQVLSFETMTDEQFDEFNRRLDSGQVYRIR